MGLRTDKVAQRLNPEMMIRIEVDGNYIRPNKYNTENSYHPSKGVSNIRRSFWMLAINEYGIYEALFASKKVEDILEKIKDELDQIKEAGEYADQETMEYGG